MLSDIDNGGRRSGADRRKFSYTLHVPERRSGSDRREIELRNKASHEKPDVEPLTL